MTTSFNENFLEDNFLSDNDWATRESLDFSFAYNFIDGSKTKTCDSDNTESPMSDWAFSSSSNSESPTYIQHENETNNFVEFDINDLIGFDSPPLTPSDKQRKISVDDILGGPASHTSPESDVTSMEDVMSELSPGCYATVSNNSMSLGDVGMIDDKSSENRYRSSSDASSTSAYSSQSSTPPPVQKSSPDIFEEAFCNAAVEQRQTAACHNTTYLTDEGFHEATSTLQTIPTSQVTHLYTRNSTTSRQRKLPNPKRNAPIVISDEEESDFDKQVKDALRETNRLLNMHKRKNVDSVESDEVLPTSQPELKKKPSINLHQLCDNIILRNGTPSSVYLKPLSTLETVESNCEEPSGANRILKDLKRKSPDKQHHHSKKTSIPQTNQIVFTADSLTSSRTTAPSQVKVQPNVLQACQLPVGNSFQIPLSTMNQPAMKIIVKQEASNAQHATMTASNNLPPNIIKPNMVTSPVRQPLVEDASVIVKEEIPLDTIVIKPDVNISSIPLSAINMSNRQPGTIKVLPGTLNCKNPTTLLPFLHKSASQATNEVKTVNTKPSAKPLMVSMPPKKQIVPNYTPTYPSMVFGQNGVGLTNGQSVLDSLGTSNPEPVVLNNMETRVMKRQQRMIKNRESACQSRQRRKEYVNSLEQQMNDCLNDNNKLRTLNAQLKNRISELEQENASLRNMASMSTVGQRKAVCLLMLVFFIGFNINPLGFLANPSISEEASVIDIHADANITKSDLQNWAVPAETIYHARQLLSLEEQTAAENEKLKGVPSQIKDLEDLKLSELRRKYTYWMDDMVKDYKKKHFGRIFEILQDTSSVSLQRLLRRKLKEELGIRVPMPVPRMRRISYTPRIIQERHTIADSTLPNDFMSTDITENDVKIPPPPPNVKEGASAIKKQPPLTASRCDHPGRHVEQPNQTESIRISDNIAKWIEHHEVQQRKSKNIAVPKSPEDSRRKVKKRRVTNDMPQQTAARLASPSADGTGIAVYEKRDDKMRRLLEAIDRKNDTVYMISFGKDHILLPAAMVNTSAHTKLSLVLPTVSPNESFVSEDHQTMIQINCEVISTDYLQVRRDLLSDEQFTSHHAEKWKSHRHNHENPKRQAFHGSTQTHSVNHGKRKLVQSGTASYEKPTTHDDDATVTEVIDL